MSISDRTVVSKTGKANQIVFLPLIDRRVVIRNSRNKTNMVYWQKNSFFAKVEGPRGPRGQQCRDNVIRYVTIERCNLCIL